MSISPKFFFDSLCSGGVRFFTGVPDSLLKDFCAYVEDEVPSENHIIAANEGGAVALAAGHFLATNQVPLVYMQNSGLGNSVNPLVSLADPGVYSIPMVLLVGWRGRPGVNDEPQHVKQGEITGAMFDSMGIPWQEVRGDEKQAEDVIAWALGACRKRQGPVVLLVREKAFSEYSNAEEPLGLNRALMSREQSIAIISQNLPTSGIVVGTTGMISREIYEGRLRRGEARDRDFLTVGSMGHASQVAQGLSQSLPDLNVTCLDGDGAALMHLGGLAVIGTTKLGNLLHIVLNNGVHDSVGGQPTAATKMSLTGVARACGYDVVEEPIVNRDDLETAIRRLASLRGKRFLEVLVRPGHRTDLGRPKESPIENRDKLVSFLRERSAQVSKPEVAG